MLLFKVLFNFLSGVLQRVCFRSEVFRRLVSSISCSSVVRSRRRVFGPRVRRAPEALLVLLQPQEALPSQRPSWSAPCWCAGALLLSVC